MFYMYLTIYGCSILTSSNGAYVYVSVYAYVNRNAWYGWRPVFLYLYRDPKTAELVWVFGCTIHDKPEDVNDPRYRPNTKDNYEALFDSRPVLHEVRPNASASDRLALTVWIGGSSTAGGFLRHCRDYLGWLAAVT